MGASAGTQASAQSEPGAAQPGDAGYYPTYNQTTTRNPGGNGVAQTLTAFGGIGKIFDTMYQGQANARIAGDNAIIAKQQAQEALEAGEFDANRVQDRAARLVGTERGAMAGQGVIAGAGTGANVLSTTSQAGAMDALMIKRNAARQALGYDIKAGGDEMAGRLASATSKQEMVSTFLNTGSQEWLEGDPNYGGFRGRGVSL